MEELVCCRQATALGGLYNVRACRRYVLHVRHTLWRAAWYRMHVIAHRSPARSELGCGAPSAVLQKPAVRPPRSTPYVPIASVLVRWRASARSNSGWSLAYGVRWAPRAPSASFVNCAEFLIDEARNMRNGNQNLLGPFRGTSTVTPDAPDTPARPPSISCPPSG